MFEPQRLDRIFQLPLHLWIGQVGAAIRAVATDQNVRFHACSFCGDGEVVVELVVDCALGFYAADLGARGTEGAKEEFWCRCCCGEEFGPDGGVGGEDGYKFCGACWVGERAARIGVDLRE